MTQTVCRIFTDAEVMEKVLSPEHFGFYCDRRQHLDLDDYYHKMKKEGVKIQLLRLKALHRAATSCDTCRNYIGRIKEGNLNEKQTSE